MCVDIGITIYLYMYLCIHIYARLMYRITTIRLNVIVQCNVLDIPCNQLIDTSIWIDTTKTPSGIVITAMYS